MDALITLLLGMIDRMAAISSLFATTRAEGREPSSAELQALDDEFTTTLRPALVAAIDKAKAEGR